jgi:signal transduction histidine kinase
MGVLQEVVVIHHDITELKEAEETTRRLNEILEERVATRTAELSASEKNLRAALDAERQINLLKTSFVGMVSHEFRTPLGIIRTAVELLSRHHEKLSVQQRSLYTRSIMDAVNRMTGMMEHILLLARIDSGNVAIKLTEIDLTTWLPKVLDELKNFRPSTEFSHSSPSSDSDALRQLDGFCAIEHTVHLDIAPSDALCHARLDESLFHHIVGNLFSNACKYSPAGSRIDISLYYRPPLLHLTIRDQGVGIPADEQEHLFDGFYRGSNVGNIPGTGLGLAITKRCVELLGGSIGLESGAGNGTTFTVRLPISPSLPLS